MLRYALKKLNFCKQKKFFGKITLNTKLVLRLKKNKKN